MPGRYSAYAQDYMNLRILHILEETFLLDADQIFTLSSTDYFTCISTYYILSGDFNIHGGFSLCVKRDTTFLCDFLFVTRTSAASGKGSTLKGKN